MARREGEQAVALVRVWLCDGRVDTFLDMLLCAWSGSCTFLDMLLCACVRVRVCACTLVR